MSLIWVRMSCRFDLIIMYISKIIIDGFRGFKHSEIEFQEGLNVIIGQNNGGKSSIMDALRLVLEYGSQKNLRAWDFCQKVDMQTLKDNPPFVKVSVFIKEQDKEGMSDDVALFTNYAVQTSPLLESCLTYVYSLPLTEVDKYKKDVADIMDKYSLFKVIEDKYIRKYTHTIYGGPVSAQNQAQGEDLKKIDFEFVNALRNVEDEIFGGRAALLKDVLRYFLDYDLNEDKDREKKVVERHQLFMTDTHDVIEKLVERINAGKDNIVEYANRTGALFSNNNLNLEGNVTEVDLLAVLDLLVGNGKDEKLPVALNGLGYNNLIYISLLLAKMQSNAKVDFMGSSNVKAFSVLAIEEPEAHLHPQMQYQFLEFLRNNIVDKHVKQVFVTSHSPSLVASVKLDELCCLHRLDDGSVKVYSPKKVLVKDEPAKKFIQRYLDATRADMLFAGGVIFVEGIAEQVLLPVFARLLGLYDKWLKKHIVVINIGGRFFDNFLKIYDSTNPDALALKVACITDRDPVRKEKGKANARFESCKPTEYNVDTAKYEYNNHSELLVEKYKKHQNVHYFSQGDEGCTLEYEIALCNPTNKALLVPSLRNTEELKKMMEAESVDKVSIAVRYLESVSKGVNALELSNAIMDLSETDREKFNVPTYIKDAIEWVLS